MINFLSVIIRYFEKKNYTTFIIKIKNGHDQRMIQDVLDAIVNSPVDNSRKSAMLKSALNLLTRSDTNDSVFNTLANPEAAEPKTENKLADNPIITSDNDKRCNLPRKYKEPSENTEPEQDKIMVYVSNDTNSNELSDTNENEDISQIYKLLVIDNSSDNDFAIDHIPDTKEDILKYQNKLMKISNIITYISENPDLDPFETLKNNINNFILLATAFFQQLTDDIDNNKINCERDSISSLSAKYIHNLFQNYIFNNLFELVYEKIISGSKKHIELLKRFIDYLRSIGYYTDKIPEFGKPLSQEFAESYVAEPIYTQNSSLDGNVGLINSPAYFINYLDESKRMKKLCRPGNVSIMTTKYQEEFSDAT